MKILSGNKIVGGNPARGRVEEDFYATPAESVRTLLQKEDIIYPCWEPACGDGAICKVLISHYGERKLLFASDLIDRGFGNCGIDFLKVDRYLDCTMNTIITNPPFSLFQEFAEHALKIAQKKVILFGKLQALEGNKRATFMESSPLRTVYVFKRRQNPLRNGSPVDENGKAWSSTMAFAWFVWEIGHQDKTEIKWI